MRTLKVKPPSSSLARSDAEIMVARANVSRWYPRTRRPFSIVVEYFPFFFSASLTSNRSAKSQPASMRTVRLTGFSAWLRIVNSSWKPSPTARRLITESFAST